MRERMASSERRVFGRRHSCIHATLFVPGRPPSPCIVRNFSDAGALLELSEPIEPPFQVKLRLSSLGSDIDCEVRHARGMRLGVSFVSAGVADELSRALGGIVRKRSARTPAAGVSALPRVKGSELRRLVLKQKMS